MRVSRGVEPSFTETLILVNNRRVVAQGTSTPPNAPAHGLWEPYDAGRLE